MALAGKLQAKFIRWPRASVSAPQSAIAYRPRIVLSPRGGGRLDLRETRNRRRLGHSARSPSGNGFQVDPETLPDLRRFGAHWPARPPTSVLFEGLQGRVRRTNTARTPRPPTTDCAELGAAAAVAWSAVVVINFAVTTPFFNLRPRAPGAPGGVGFERPDDFAPPPSGPGILYDRKSASK